MQLVSARESSTSALSECNPHGSRLAVHFESSDDHKEYTVRILPLPSSPVLPTNTVTGVPESSGNLFASDAHIVSCNDQTLDGCLQDSQMFCLDETWPPFISTPTPWVEYPGTSLDEVNTVVPINQGVSNTTYIISDPAALGAVSEYGLLGIDPNLGGHYGQDALSDTTAGPSCSSLLLAAEDAHGVEQTRAMFENRHSIDDLGSSSESNKGPKKRSKHFRCEYSSCDRRFTSEYTRKVHMKTHEPKAKKAFHCTMGCSEVFSRQHDRFRHEVIQHGKVCEYVCAESTCRRYFSSARMLENHKCTGRSRWSVSSS